MRVYAFSVHGQRNTALLPCQLEDEPGVANGESRRSNDHHGTFKYHEGDFLVGQITAEAGMELGDTEARSDEDCYCGDGDCYTKTRSVVHYGGEQQAKREGGVGA